MRTIMVWIVEAALFLGGLLHAQSVSGNWQATLQAEAGVAATVDFTPPPNIAGQSAWIPLRHQRQEANLCVPTSASIILDYFGEQLSPRKSRSFRWAASIRPRRLLTISQLRIFTI
jgi:hypothetical protein